MKTSFEVANAPIATANRSAAAVTIRPVRSRPIATASAVGDAAVVCLFDPGEQEDGVVGCEAEPDREEEDRLGCVERAVASVGEQALQVAVLEDQHEDAEDGAQAEHVHQYRFHRRARPSRSSGRGRSASRRSRPPARAADELRGCARGRRTPRSGRRRRRRTAPAARARHGRGVLRRVAVRRCRRARRRAARGAGPAGRGGATAATSGGRGSCPRRRAPAASPAGAPTTTSSGAVRPGGNSRAERLVDLVRARARGQRAGVDGQELDRR